MRTAATTVKSGEREGTRRSDRADEGGGALFVNRLIVNFIVGVFTSTLFGCRSSKKQKKPIREFLTGLIYHSKDFTQC